MDIIYRMIIVFFAILIIATVVYGLWFIGGLDSEKDEDL